METYLDVALTDSGPVELADAVAYYQATADALADSADARPAPPSARTRCSRGRDCYVGAGAHSVGMAENPPLANLITLGAWDFTALRDFYRRLGWPQVIDEENFAAFELRGTVLAVFPLADLARDGNTDPAPATGGISFTIGVLVDSAEEVDQLTGHMRAAGARVTKDPVDAEFFTGRSAYLCDPEGNYFEIAWAAHDNPVSAAARRAAGL